MNHILRYFRNERPAEAVRDLAQAFADFAERLAVELPDNDQRLVALQRLLEAKDAACRSYVSPPEDLARELAEKLLEYQRDGGVNVRL